MMMFREEYKHRYRTFRQNMQTVKLLQETEQVSGSTSCSASPFFLVLRFEWPPDKVVMIANKDCKIEGANLSAIVDPIQLEKKTFALSTITD